MTGKKNIRMLGLYGTPGAGKSTTTRIIEDYCSNKGIPLIRIKLADPLYEAQSAIYTIAGKQLSDFYEQDGELLNFLGSYLRKLNPNVLLDRFSTKLVEATDHLNSSDSSSGIIVCDDMRRPDADFLKKKEFSFVRIIADSALCEKRRMERGDRSLGSASHATEQGLDEIVPDYLIHNETTLEELSSQVNNFMERLYHDLNRDGDTA